MRTKTFKFLSCPDSGALKLLQSRLQGAIQDGVGGLRIDLSDAGACPESVKKSLESLAEGFRDRLNHPVEVIYPAARVATPAVTKTRIPAPDKEGTCELKLSEYGLGELDLAATDRLYELVIKAGASGAKMIFLNFSGVTSLSAGAIMTLIKLKRALAKDERELLLLFPDKSRVYQVIQATALTEGFRIGFTN